MDKKIIIQKLGSEKPEVHQSKKGKTLKTFPRGIIKKSSKFTLKGTSDPAKSPPLKKGMKKHTLRMLTEKGAKRHRKTLKRRISRMSDSKVQDVVRGKGLVLNPRTPPEISREILRNAVSAGFVSV
uniref:Uncharacterized protein n=1 Tax=viral metagenome TaxID=1070528 RepID=A0A6C0B2Z2_9ZZZZ